jgi:hypothetical protein
MKQQVLPIEATRQVAPVADHHQHLFSPGSVASIASSGGLPAITADHREILHTLYLPIINQRELTNHLQFTAASCLLGREIVSRKGKSACVGPKPASPIVERLFQ